MKLHLVSGFLGSGKTTAIATAAKLLGDQEKTAAVVTNDQGRYLVDSRFMDLADLPSAEVTGGCFCCSFHELEKQIRGLRETAHPDVIFAESVGSCTDLIATVVKPLQLYHPEDIEAVTFSAFVDARLLLQHARGARLPFTEDTNYIWEKQIEEAEILVVNKVDLLHDEDLQLLREYAARTFAGKRVIFQNSLDPASIKPWTALLGSIMPPHVRRSVTVDYARYGQGEADLAWLDEELTFTSTAADAARVAAGFIDALLARIRQVNAPIGHLKFFASNGSDSVKVSYTTVSDPAAGPLLPFDNAPRVTLVVNARVQMPPETLRRLLLETVEEVRTAGKGTVDEREVAFFRPGFPNPTYRVGNLEAA